MITEYALIVVCTVLLAMCGRLYEHIRALQKTAARASHLEHVVAELLESQAAELRGERDSARTHLAGARNAYITIDSAGRL